MRPCSLAKAIMLPLKDTAPMRAPRMPSTAKLVGRVVDAQELGGGDGRGRAAAHAVVERDHLRHVGHRDLARRDPGDAAARGHGDAIST